MTMRTVPVDNLRRKCMKERLKIAMLSGFTLIGGWIISLPMTVYAILPHSNDFFRTYFVLTYTQLIVGRVMSIAILFLLLAFGFFWIVKMCKARRKFLKLRIIGVIVLQLALLCLLEYGVLVLAFTFAHTEYSSGGLGMSHILGVPFYYYLS